MEDGIAVNVAGVNYNQGDTLKLDVKFGDGLTEDPQSGPSTETGEEFFYDDGPGSLRNFVDVSGNSITYRGEFDGDFTDADVDFVGFVVEDVNGTLPPITNMIISGSSSLPVDGNNVQFNENRIEFNLDALFFTNEGTITVDVEFGAL